MPCAKTKEAVNNQVTTCALCHLPANYYDGLSDLYGPYYASCKELLEQSKKQENENHDLYINKIANEIIKSDYEQIRIDKYSKVCFITVPELSSKTHQSIGHSSNLVKELKKSVKNDSINYCFLHTIDYLLPDQKRSFSHFKGTARIPGFHGVITISSVNERGEYQLTSDVTSEELNLALCEVEIFVFIRSCHTSNTSPSTSERCIPFCTRVVNKALWIHDKCAEHAPGIYCVGNKVFNVFTTVKEAHLSNCAVCCRPGATICPRLFPKHTYHYLCACKNGIPI